jgi:opacity protein-like surface antigen
LAGLNVNFSKALSGKLGYRYFYFGREESDVLFKFGLAGFYGGLGIGC